ncbi:sulfotransferase family protein [Nonomuraea sp. 10N515B]|uniref:sulfotransferase family protein n=1 Tax=Nonomuraea sp. 10N515B TaxID=3457422 RepID=UPI003FCC728A
MFFISPVRSGSTLLRSILNAHPDLHAPHELHVRRLSVDFGTGLAEKAMTALGHNRADLEHLLCSTANWCVLRKRHIVDKTPAHAFAYERIAACWPDARYIFLTQLS